MLQLNIYSPLSVPREAIESLWRSYNLYCEGWGLDMSELETILSGASYFSQIIGFNESDLKALFLCFDTDKNGLVDALEILVTLGMISGMDTIDKVQFCFSGYDFTESGSLGNEEIALLLRSTVKGLAKANHFKIAFLSNNFKIT
eukprot:gene4657-6170_t